MHGGDHGRGHAEEDALGRHRSAVEEHANEESERDDPARGEHAERRARVEDYAGGDDGEGQDEAARDLVEGRVDVLERVVAEAGGALVRGHVGGVYAAHLKPTTFRPTIATRPLQTLRSKCRRSGSRRRASEARKRSAAMASCVNRKKSGVLVLISTHLFLRDVQEGERGRARCALTP